MPNRSPLTIVGEPKGPARPAVPQPPNRGRLYYDFQIPDAFYGGLPGIGDKVRWVRAHLPRATRIKIGRASAWYEADIRDHIERERAGGRGPGEAVAV